MKSLRQFIFRKPKPSKGDEYLYHGTKTVNYQKIKREGLKAITNHFTTNQKYAEKHAVQGEVIRMQRKNLPGHKEDSAFGHVYTKKPIKAKYLEVLRNGNWKRVLDERVLNEMPVKSDRDSAYLDDPKSDSDFERYLKEAKFTKLGTFKGYDVVQNHTVGDRGYALVHPGKKEVHLVLKGINEAGSFNIRWSHKHSKAKVKMSDFMHHLITQHNITINSDASQSRRAALSWKHLSKAPGINVNLIKDPFKTKGKFETEPLHPDWEANFGDFSVFQAKKK